MTLQTVLKLIHNKALIEPTPPTAMQCSVFKSPRREYLYLYLKQGAALDEIPEDLAKVFGEPQFVIDLELSHRRPLAQEDVKQVMNNLETQGFHLQMPPGEKGDLL